MKTWSVPRSAWIESDAAMSIWRINARPSSKARISMPEHAVGAVDECEPLLFRKLHGRESRVGEHIDRASTHPTRVAHVAFAHEGERHVRERRQVPRAAE